jgi:hypothetical protein
MLYPAIADWNSKCFWNIERRRIQLATTNIIATAIYLFDFILCSGADGTFG